MLHKLCSARRIPLTMAKASYKDDIPYSGRGVEPFCVNKSLTSKTIEDTLIASIAFSLRLCTTRNSCRESASNRLRSARPVVDSWPNHHTKLVRETDSRTLNFCRTRISWLSHPGFCACSKGLAGLKEYWILCTKWTKKRLLSIELIRWSHTRPEISAGRFT